MKAKTTIVYIAFDGKEFTSETECEEYENKNNLRELAEKKLFDVTEKIKKLLNENDMRLEYDDFDGINLCYNEDYDGLCVSL